MDILFSAFHVIDVENMNCISKEIPDSFNNFIEDYLQFMFTNEKKKEYQILSEEKEVSHCISEMVLNEENREENANQIAKKLLECERVAQGKIFSTGTKVKRGSLVQALIKDDDSFQFLIAKVEHTKWYDGNSLSENYGFSADKNNVWKVAVFSLFEINDTVIFDKVQVFNDTKSQYWPHSFLELEEVRSDVSNTTRAFQAMDTELKNSIKNISPRDYVVLTQEIQNTMNQTQDLVYEDYVEDLMEAYTPTNPDIQKEEIKENLLALPKRKKFDSEFTTIPQSIANKRTKKYKIAEGVELTIHSDATSFASRIISTMAEGQKILQIYCDDEDTYEAFIEE